MVKILKDDQGALVTLEDNGLVKKVVRGLNRSRLRWNIAAEEMVDREIRALERLKDVEGVQRFVRRESKISFYSVYIEGDSLKYFSGKLPRSYFDRLESIVKNCHKEGVYPLIKRRDIFVTPDLKPALIDFGNVLFDDDTIAQIPYVSQSVMALNYLRIAYLRTKL